MLYLILCILFSSSLFVIFKLFNNYKIQTLYAIITNYFVASIFSLFFYKETIILTDLPNKLWFTPTVCLGFLFITVFYVTALTSQKIGVSVASVASKMSLVIPVIVGVSIYNENLSLLKIIGILLALSAVYFSSLKDKKSPAINNSFLLPLLLFLGSGSIDASLKYLQKNHVPENEFPLFCSVVFLSAGVLGLLFILIRSYKIPLKKNYKNLVGGIILGVFNYITLYFLLKALQNSFLDSSSIFTINNVAVVLFTTLLGILLFKEKLIIKNWIGIGLAVISIILVALF
ncbi:DMT family transporter [Cellulophaga baltica]|uniref:DMT family transporter n=1 Tax=Cellulophaga TaxID=104264 RepID=UPI001C0692A6|nr:MULTISPECIES: DMT family transporter [Cellulophaga]MBU2996017.1 DMT family transporter [Cellulophaga baltica]MDO6767412.1 DMT family transporter [Cellulophaga sp. 1_MG-2023]